MENKILEEVCGLSLQDLKEIDLDITWQGEPIITEEMAESSSKRNADDPIDASLIGFVNGIQFAIDSIENRNSDNETRVVEFLKQKEEENAISDEELSELTTKRNKLSRQISTLKKATFEWVRPKK